MCMFTVYPFLATYGVGRSLVSVRQTMYKQWILRRFRVSCGNLRCMYAFCIYIEFPKCVVMTKLCFWIIALVTTLTNGLTHRRNCHVTQKKRLNETQKYVMLAIVFRNLITFRSRIIMIFFSALSRSVTNEPHPNRTTAWAIILRHTHCRNMFYKINYVRQIQESHIES